MSETEAIFRSMSIRNLKRVEHGLLLMQARKAGERRRISPQVRDALAASDRNTEAMMARERGHDHPVTTCIE